MKSPTVMSRTHACFFCLFMLVGWSKAQASLANLVGAQLVNTEGKSIEPADLEGKTIGLFFSAQWCPPCRAFTPELVKFRNANQQEFEVVFVSGDRSREAQAGYMKKYAMPWPAIPYNAPQRNGTFDRFGVRGIPALVIVDDQGRLLERDGRAALRNDPANALDLWNPSRKKAPPSTSEASGGEAAAPSSLDVLQSQTQEAVNQGFDLLRQAEGAAAPVLEKINIFRSRGEQEEGE